MARQWKVHANDVWNRDGACHPADKLLHRHEQDGLPGARPRGAGGEDGLRAHVRGEWRALALERGDGGALRHHGDLLPAELRPRAGQQLQHVGQPPGGGGARAAALGPGQHGGLVADVPGRGGARTPHLPAARPGPPRPGGPQGSQEPQGQDREDAARHHHEPEEEDESEDVPQLPGQVRTDQAAARPGGCPGDQQRPRPRPHAGALVGAAEDHGLAQGPVI